MATLIFLGTGSSSGTPILLCTCSVCRSKDPKNRRRRASLYVEVEGKKLLIDSGPDFREQALAYQIDQVDALFLTHTHFDHIAGIDDLRPYCYVQKRTIETVLSNSSYLEMQKRYSYLFQESASYTVSLQFRPLLDGAGRAEVAGIPFSYFSYFQSGMEVTGFRFGNMAYITDIADYTQSLFDALSGIETLILGAGRWEPSKAQLSFPEAIAFAERVQPKVTYLTHISHEVAHQEEPIAPNVYLAYDGLKLNF